jgi:hypothetical protein
MEKEYICDNCDVEMEIFDIGILASIEEECSFTTKMICLCKPCTLQREKDLEKDLKLIQYAIKSNIKLIKQI